MTTKFPRIRRDLTRMGIGIVQIATRAKNAREHNRRVALFDELVEHSQVAVIKALLMKPGEEGALSWEELIDHRRRNQGRVGVDALADVALNKPLLATIDATIPKMGNVAETRRRYQTTRDALTRKGAPYITAETTVRGLLEVDWGALRATWGQSAADWNHVLRLCRAFASRYRGQRSVFAAQVWEALSPFMLPEDSRVPDITAEVFRKIVETARPDVGAALWVLALTGMRVGEYLRCTRADLRPETRQLVVPGRKTKAARAPLSFEADDWAYIDTGIPCRLQYRRLYELWERACVAVGAGAFVSTGERKRVKLPLTKTGRPKAGTARQYAEVDRTRYVGLRIHDLRHFCAQEAADSGVSLSDIRAQLRHTTIAQTEKYARRQATRRVAAAVGGSLRKKA